ncbi:MAG: hypothetical protein SFW63_08245 [Alphaproteobacteria bacterium]|nr:hypothetical protein [Alphaproteobacteria bacterium]
MPSFSTRRGRPPSHKPATDYGTPELIARRARGETSEAIDLCLERRLITPAEHWCGLHLRWLHTLRHGAPGVSALALTDGSKTLPRESDEAWQRDREKEYREAIAVLQSRHLIHPIVDICIYDRMPKNLRSFGKVSTSNHKYDFVQKLKMGLGALDSLWNGNI